MMYNSKTDSVCLDGDILKLIAAAAMLVDHIGAILFPRVIILRIVGRIAFPIFAFFVAEGCHYTKNKGRYLFNLLLFATVTQGIKVIFNDNDDLNIMFTFAIAVAVIFVFQKLVTAQKAKDEKEAVYMSLLFAALIAVVWLVNSLVVIQYGFWGCVAPFIIYLAQHISNSSCTANQLKLILTFISFTAIYFAYGSVQIWAYTALFLLMLYSGQKGDRVPKYFFYIFYPSHLAILYLIKIFI